jgi:hypothetical protein
VSSDENYLKYVLAGTVTAIRLPSVFISSRFARYLHFSHFNVNREGFNVFEKFYEFPFLSIFTCFGSSARLITCTFVHRVPTGDWETLETITISNAHTHILTQIRTLLRCTNFLRRPFHEKYKCRIRTHGRVTL